MEINFKNRKAMSPKRARGEVARANLYMPDRYNINISAQQRKLFEIWNKQYPASERECKKEQLVSDFQGNNNLFFVESCALSKAH